MTAAASSTSHAPSPPAPGQGPRLRVLVVTSEFPNCLHPTLAAFNRQQFVALSRRCDVDLLATIPWFPGARWFARWSEAGREVEVPREEIIDGLPVRHPRYLFIPRVGYAFGGLLHAASLAPEVRRRRGRYDVLLASWAFPDGVGGVLLARLLGIPCVVKVHGSDINVLARKPFIRANLRWAFARTARVVAVSRPLAEGVVELGAPRERVDVVPNGVDGALFHPSDRAEARAALGHAADRRPWLLYVGRLEASKGVLDLLAALGHLAARRPDARLVFVGDGTERDALARAAAGPLGDRILLAGPRPLQEVPRWMAACDALVLPSWAEGTPNVVLEALACGRRVVATAVGGTPDVVTGPELGELVPARQPEVLAVALERAIAAPYASEAVARAGARLGWDESALRLEASLREALR